MTERISRSRLARSAIVLTEVPTSITPILKVVRGVRAGCSSVILAARRTKAWMALGVP